MKKSDLFIDNKLLNKGKETSVYVGYNSLSKEKVIVKKYNSLNIKSLKQLSNEFQVASGIDLAGVRKAYSLDGPDNDKYLLLEYIEGVTLSQFINNTQLDISEFLKIAIKITAIFEQVHQKQIVHRKISSDHIMIDQYAQDIKVINLSSAVFLGSQGTIYGNFENVEASYTHMAPEQTGRVQRRIDYRTDIYSLGVVFYEMLTGKLPFKDNGFFDLVHAHLAKEPQQISDINNQVPPILNSLVHKMLQKDPNERYQTMFGVRCDLQECLRQWNENNQIGSFELGKEDYSTFLMIPDKLYGRENEIIKVKAVFDQVIVRDTAILLMSGYAGVGKTSLMHELRNYTREKQGFFVEGKFGQYQRNIPYTAWFQAFHEFVNQLLALDNDEIENWKQTIKQAIGDNGKIMTDVIPDLEIIMGKQPDVPDLGSVESQNRFNTVLKNFISVIATKQHPLVVFLDDLQWVDNASLNLIKQLLTESDISYFLFAGAYRDNETDQKHPLFKAFTTLKDSHRNVVSIHLTNLSNEAVSHLIKDALHSSYDDCVPLSKVIYEKTGGNAFFVHQMLHSFDDKSILKYNPTKRKWLWDTELLKTIQITDNIVDLMVDKIQKLPVLAQKAIQFAACVGNQFNQSMLSIITQVSTSELHDILMLIISEGLLFPSKNNYKFAHDRIQQAAYSLIPLSQQKKIHLQIGKLLLKNITKEHWDVLIFDIVNQINLGAEKSTDVAENYEFASANLYAGRKAKLNAAYVAAYEYFEAGISFVDENDWQNQYNLILELYTEAIDAAYMCGRYDKMNTLATIAHSKVNIEIDKIFIYETEIKALAAQGKLIDAIRHGIIALNNLGFVFPEEPEWDYVWKRFGVALSHLNEIGIEGLKSLPLMESPDKLAYTRILSALGEPAYAAAPNVFILWASEYALISFENRQVSMSPFGYAAFALALCSTGQYIDAGYQLASMAVQLVELSEAKSSRCRVLNIFGGTIQFWKEHLRNTTPIMEQGIEAGLENGDHISGSYSAFGMSMNMFNMGETLSSVEKRIVENLNTIKYFRQGFIWYMATGFLEAIRRLMGVEIKQFPLDGFDRSQSLVEAKELNNIGGLGIYYITKLSADYVLGLNETLKDCVDRAKEFASGFQGTFCVPVLYFYESLVTLRFGISTNEIPLHIKENQEKLLALSAFAPHNFQHKYNLVAAELARCLGNHWEAANLYQKAITGARESLYLQEEALAYELAAFFYESENLNELAIHHIKQAFDAYKRWGATAKIAQLLKKYPEWLADKMVENKEVISMGESIDIESIMKASHSISSEIEMNKLLSALMKILVQNAGAQIGYLILKSDEFWEITASYDTYNEDSIFLEKKIENSTYISNKIINYVIRTQKPVLLNDALNEGEFRNEAVFKSEKSRSVLCTPLIIRGKLNGLLYFENKLIPYAFTENRIKILEMLATQAAISIENASFYDKLRKLNQSLEQEIEERRINEQKYRLLADNSNDEISRHSLDNIKYLYASPSCKQILGYEPEELIGRSAFEIIHPDDHHAIFQAIKVIAEKNNVVVTFRKMRKDGTYIWAETNNHLIRDEITGEPKEIHSCTRDITERKNFEEALLSNEYLLKQQNEEYITLNEELIESNERIQNMNIELMKAKEKAEESDKLKSAFLANMSHEIRTPMNGIMGFADLLKSPELTGEMQAKYIDIIRQSGERMLNIINDLVDISKIEAGLTEINNDAINPSDLLKNILYFFEPEATKKGLVLKVELPQTSVIVESDKTKLSQVLSNLVKNSLKFTHQGAIAFGYKQKNNFLEFYVKDSGIGILPEHQTLIFERFRQADLSLSKPYEGAGLGLSISKSFVEMMGGEMWLESSPGKGSCFYFTIPYSKKAESIITQAKISYKIKQDKHITVLLAEDDEINYLFINEVLSKENITIMWAKNGQEAIDIVKTNAQIQLVLMDIKMPILNGFDATRAIKQINPKLRVIVLTAYAASSDKEKAKAAGCDDFLAKPIQKEELFNHIMVLLKQ